MKKLTIEKNYLFRVVFPLLAMLMLCGCGQNEKQPVETSPSDALQEDAESNLTRKEIAGTGKQTQAPDETTSTSEVQNMTSVHIGPGRDKETVKEYLSQFPDDLQNYENWEDYYVLTWRDVYGQEYWDAFMEAVDSQTPAYITLVQYTVEGDPILYYLNYDGTDCYMMSDSSRDGFGGTGERYYEYTYATVKVYTIHNWAGDEFQSAYLVNEPNLPWAELQYSYLLSTYYDGIPQVDARFLFERRTKERDAKAPNAVPEKLYTKEVNNLPGVTMKLLYAYPNEIGVEIHNDTDEDILFGEDYDLQILQDGEWYSLSYVIDNAAFNSVGLPVKAGDSRIWGTDWIIFHGVLGEGDYRVVKSVSASKAGDSHTNYPIAVEFSLQ